MRLDRRIKTSLLAILGDVTLVGVKLGAATVTNSAALLADALHSVSDLIVSLILLIGLVTRAHQEQGGSARGVALAYRLEAGLAILVAVIILLFPIEILSDVTGQRAEPVEHVWVGILAVVFCIAVAAFMAALKSSVGEETDSLALQADGQHSQLDVLSSIAVLVSLVGLMVGIDIDVPVAIVIAVLVASVGVELLLAGIKGLLKGQRIEQQSLARLVLDVLPIGGLVVIYRQRLARLAQPVPLTAAGLLVLAGYLGTGLQQVPAGHQGVRYTLLRADDAALEPGLHYAAPWPFGDIRVVDTGRVHRLHLSGREGAAATPGTLDGLLWQSVRLDEAIADGRTEVQGFATADENLVEVLAVVQYRLLVEAASGMDTGEIDRLVAATARHALSMVIASRSLESLAQVPPAALSDEAMQRFRGVLIAGGVAIEPVSLQILGIRPPAPVVAAYRDVTNADQKRLEMQRRAEATRLIDLSRAAAERAKVIEGAAATAVEQHARAQAEAGQFATLADMYQAQPGLLRLHQQWDAIESSLAGRPLRINDPRISPQDLRAWSATQP